MGSGQAPTRVGAGEPSATTCTILPCTTHRRASYRALLRIRPLARLLFRVCHTCCRRSTRRGRKTVSGVDEWGNTRCEGREEGRGGVRREVLERRARGGERTRINHCLRSPRPSAPTAYERVDKTAASRSRLSNRIPAVSHTHWCLLSRASRPTVPPSALQHQVRRPDDKPHPTAYNSRALRTTRRRSQQPASPSQCFRALTASSELALAP
ncbi:hypothetical protein K438DRAFT_539015 [Mycena galopus ATCC 62051]|nr:hypothetical protein K438DRAFT_539015 [Mycena galopus ATCC 62051]